MTKMSTLRLHPESSKNFSQYKSNFNSSKTFNLKNEIEQIKTPEIKEENYIDDKMKIIMIRSEHKSKPENKTDDFNKPNDKSKSVFSITKLLNVAIRTNPIALLDNNLNIAVHYLNSIRKGNFSKS